MSVFSARLAEYGGYYVVQNVHFTEVKYILPSAIYISLGNEIALQLKNELNKGKLIRLSKDKIEKTDLTIDDFDIIEANDLQTKKSTLKAKANQRLSMYTATISALEIFGFFATAGKLIEQGYNVFDKDKQEDVYLKIVETADDDLILDLEEFLEARDKYNEIWRKHRSVKEYFREIDSCETVEELDEVVEDNKGWLTE